MLYKDTPVQKLSKAMSAVLEIANEEDSTINRIGNAIFEKKTLTRQL